MVIKIGHSSSEIHVGPEFGAAIHVGESGPDIHVGASGAEIVVGSQKVMAAVLDGVTSHITIDGLAPVAYSQTGDWHWVMLVMAAPTGVNSPFFQSTGGSQAAITYHAVAARNDSLWGIVAKDGAAVLNVNGGPSELTQDGGWHLVQGADHYAAPNGDVYMQADGAARLSYGAYARWAGGGTHAAYVTFGARRYGAVPTIDQLFPMTLGYAALITGEKLTQLQMDAINAAFDTGGGRLDPTIISRVIQEQLTTGALKYAITLDGGGPHVDPDGVGLPTYVDCTFEPANYQATEYAYMDATPANIQLSDADAALVTAQLKSASGPITVLAVLQSDPELGDATVYREIIDVSNEIDTGGSLWVLSRSSATTGAMAFTAADDATTILRQGDTTAMVVDGGLTMFQVVETATGSTAQTKASVDGGAFLNFGAAWNRASLGQLDKVNISGGARGPDPTVDQPELGHCYFRAIIHEDLTADRTALWTAFSTALGDSAQNNMHAACRALMVAIKAAVSDDSPGGPIKFAMEFNRGAIPDYGDAPTMVGVSYSEPGVTP